MRFRLITLFVLIALIAWCSSIVVQRQQEQKIKNRLATIVKPYLFDKVQFDCEFSRSPRLSEESLLWDVVGGRYFYFETEDDERQSSDALERFFPTRRPRSIKAYFGSFTSQAWQEVSDCSSIVGLVLCDCKVSPLTIKLPITHLGLERCEGDSNAEVIRHCPRLEWFSMQSKVYDAEIHSAITSCRKIRFLRISACDVTLPVESLVDDLLQLPELTSLSTNGPIALEILRRIEDLPPSLESLELIGTNFTRFRNSTVGEHLKNIHFGDGSCPDPIFIPLEE